MIYTPSDCNTMYWNLLSMLNAFEKGPIDYGAFIQELDETRACDKLSPHLKTIRGEVKSLTGHYAYGRIVKNIETSEDLNKASKSIQYHHQALSMCAYNSLSPLNKLYYQIVQGASQFGMIGGLEAFAHRTGPYILELRKRYKNKD